MEERLNMGMKEREKLRAIGNILEGRITQKEAAEILGQSERHIRRLCAGVRERGERSLVHGLRGRPSNHHLDAELLGQALSALHHPKWEEFGPTFCKEKLEEFFGIKLGKTTIYKLMILTNLWEPHCRGTRHRAWRERRHIIGIMVQLDGSDHDWLEGRGPRCVLLIYIDDATSQILYGEFVEVEDTLTLMRASKNYFQSRGLPASFYVDRDSIYKVNRQASVDEELKGAGPVTQFSRAMEELGIKMIFALSPQAKGRVERGFKTHQDRLVKELRLRDISTMEEANRYLWEEYIPKHNARYAVEPAKAGDAHRPLLPNHNLNEILSLRTMRVVGNNFTVRFQNRYFQILEDQPVRVRPKDTVELEIRLDASTHLRFKGCYLDFKSLDQSHYVPFLKAQPSKANPGARSPQADKGSTPAKDHPWRKPLWRTPLKAHVATNKLKP